VVIVARLLRKKDGRWQNRQQGLILSPPSNQTKAGRGLIQSPPLEWAVMVSIPPAELSSPVGSCGRQVLASKTCVPECNWCSPSHH
jgi:hypothetical protein